MDQITPTYIQLIGVITPVLVGLFALIATLISAIGLHVGNKNSKAINEVHVIVNSQKTAMMSEIEQLKIKIDILEISREASKALEVLRVLKTENTKL